MRRGPALSEKNPDLLFVVPVATFPPLFHLFTVHHRYSVLWWLENFTAHLSLFIDCVLYKKKTGLLYGLDTKKIKKSILVRVGLVLKNETWTTDNTLWFYNNKTGVYTTYGWFSFVVWGLFQSTYFCPGILRRQQHRSSRGGPSVGWKCVGSGRRRTASGAALHSCPRTGYHPGDECAEVSSYALQARGRTFEGFLCEKSAWN